MLTDTQIARAQELDAYRMAVQTIAKYVGAEQREVRALLTPNDRRLVGAPIDRAEVKRRVEAGESDQTIGAALRCSSVTIASIRSRELGLLRTADPTKAAVARTEQAEGRREAAALQSAEDRWQVLLVRRFEDADVPEVVGRLGRPDPAEGMGSSSMNY